MPPDPELEFLSCDWGTSHFRLRWMAGGKVVRQINDENGCKKLLELSKTNPVQRRSHFYEEQLCSVAALWKGFHPRVNRPIPVVISGMASSTIGWVELPYATAPIPLDGSGLNVRKVEWPKPSWIGETRLVSGLATATNMMRGEETEAIGLLNHGSIGKESLLLILPGTHSKHLQVADGILTGIQTYMTGELFDVLSRHSILTASVATAEFSEEGFRAGVECARECGMLPGLFLTRTRQVLRGRKPEENSAFLSGLLIGAELLDTRRWQPDTPLRLGGSARLKRLYSKALKLLEFANWSSLTDEECELAVARGQQLILQRLQS